MNHPLRRRWIWKWISTSSVWNRWDPRRFQSTCAMSPLDFVSAKRSRWRDLKRFAKMCLLAEYCREWWDSAVLANHCFELDIKKGSWTTSGNVCGGEIPHVLGVGPTLHRIEVTHIGREFGRIFVGCWEDSRVHDGKRWNARDHGIEFGKNGFRHFNRFGIDGRNWNWGGNRNRSGLKRDVLLFTGRSHDDRLLLSLSVCWVFLREKYRIHVYLVLSNLIHFTMDVGRGSLTVAHAATHTCTSRTFETRIICRCNNSKFALQLLQTEDPRAISALHTSKSLSALHFAT